MAFQPARVLMILGRAHAARHQTAYRGAVRPPARRQGQTSRCGRAPAATGRCSRPRGGRARPLVPNPNPARARAWKSPRATVERSSVPLFSRRGPFIERYPFELGRHHAKAARTGRPSVNPPIANSVPPAPDTWEAPTARKHRGAGRRAVSAVQRRSRSARGRPREDVDGCCGHEPSTLASRREVPAGRSRRHRGDFD